MAKEQLWYETWTHPPTCAGVYVVRDPQAGLVKIGRARNVKKRFAALSHARLFPLQFICIVSRSPERERFFHARWDDARIRGEWFYPVADLCAVISQALSEGPDIKTHRLVEATPREIEEIARWRHMLATPTRERSTQPSVAMPGPRGRPRKKSGDVLPVWHRPGD